MVGNTTITLEMQNGTLLMTLPSGRHLSYPEARLVPGKYQGTSQISFKDNAKGGWTDHVAWYGTLVENAVQAVSRDLLAVAMQRLEAAGYLVVLHCHDEAVAEVPEGFGSTEEFLRLMTTLPDWASSLPLAANAWCRNCYAESQQSKPALSTKAPTPNDHKPVEAPKVNGFHALEPVVAKAIAAPKPLQAAEGLQLVPLAALIGQPLTDGKIACPFHADGNPSCHIYDDHFHCFGCGARGDTIDWLMMVEGMNRGAAERLLDNWDGPKIPVHAHTENDHVASALRTWEVAQPMPGTLAVRYLADIRRIDIDALPGDSETLRFHPRCPFGLGKSVPCLIALYRDIATDEPAGIHRIALTREVFSGGKVERRSLGRWPRPRAIKLWPAGEHLFLGEGIETVLAAATRLQHRGVPMRPAWAAGSSGNISKFPVLADVNQLTLLVDHDASGQQSAETCRLRWRAAGRKVTRLRPKRPGADFNDLVLEQRPVAP
jgi:Toprim domain/CHC2 zinc finger